MRRGLTGPGLLATPLVTAVAVAGLVGPLGGSGVPSTDPITAATMATVAARTDPGSGPGHAGFGPDLDVSQESLATYVDRVGTDVSLAGTTLPYPLDRDAVNQVRAFSRATAAGGAAAVLTLEPADLSTLRPADAQQLAGVLKRVTRADDSYFLVRFAPEMNGSWTSWGQEPRAFVKAFRTVASAVHDSTTAAAMVWAPAYGAGYPFERAVNATTTQRDAAGLVGEAAVLDTDGDGVVDDRDDPYGPYYPGDEAADWVGLTVLRYGVRPSFGANTVPEPDELEERLDDRFGYSSDPDRRSFYDEFARGHAKPMLLVTGAAYNLAGGGADEREMKQAWLDQVVEATVDRRGLRGVLWLEKTREESEIGNEVSWGLSSPQRLAGDTRRAVKASPLALGPVAGPEGPTASSDDGTDESDAAPGPQPTDGSDTGDTTSAAAADPFDSPIGAGPSTDVLGLPPFAAGMLTTLVVLAAAAAAALRIRRRRMVPPWLR